MYIVYNFVYILFEYSKNLSPINNHTCVATILPVVLFTILTFFEKNYPESENLPRDLRTKVDFSI